MTMTVVPTPGASAVLPNIPGAIGIPGGGGGPGGPPPGGGGGGGGPAPGSGGGGGGGGPPPEGGGGGPGGGGGGALSAEVLRLSRSFSASALPASDRPLDASSRTAITFFSSPRSRSSWKTRTSQKNWHYAVDYLFVLLIEDAGVDL